MIGQLTAQETSLLIATHQEIDGHTDNLAISYELLDGEKDALMAAREKERTQAFFHKVVRRAQQKRTNEDRSRAGRGPMDMDESRMFAEPSHRERKEGAPPPASDMFFLSNILGWNPEEKYEHVDGGYQQIAEKLWREVERRFSEKKKLYVECFRLHTGNPSYWSYNELSEEFGIEPGTIRAGVHRVKKELIRLIHQIENHTFAPPHRDIPKDVLSARQLLEQQEFEAAEEMLDDMADAYPDNPFYFKALGDLASEKKLDAKAVEWYQKALAYADDPVLRSRICNNWAFTADSLGDKSGALKLWLRALRLDPDNYVPRFNILCEDSMAHNLTACKHHLHEFGELLSRGALSDEDRRDLLDSLETETELQWLRTHRPFRRTIASWCARYGEQERRAVVCHPIAVVVALLVACWFMAVGMSPASVAQSPQVQPHSHTLAKKKQRKGKKKQRRFDQGDQVAEGDASEATAAHV